MGREYSHWIDLRLISHMEVVILKIYLTKIHVLSKPTFVDVKQKYKNVQKGPEPNKPILLAKNKLEGLDLRRNMQGLRNCHLLYGPSW